MAIGPLVWAAFNATGPGMPLPRKSVFGAAAAPVSGWASWLSEPDAFGIVAFAEAAVMIGLAMGAACPRVPTATFEEFGETGGTTRVNLGVVLGASEVVGTVAEVTALAGVGSVTLNLGAPAVEFLAFGSTGHPLILWSIAARSRLWGEPD